MAKRSKSKTGSRRRSKSRSSGKGGICMNALLNYGLLGAMVIGFLVIMVQFLTPNEPSAVEGNSSKTICLIHSETCRHCKKMMPQWKNFVSNNPTNVKVKTLEANNDHDKVEIKTLTDKFNIEVDGYPSIYLLDEETNTAKPYSGGRTEEEFKKFCKDNQ